MLIKIGRKKINLFRHNSKNEIYCKCIVYYWISSISNLVLKRILGGGNSAIMISAIICFPLFFVFALKAFIVLINDKKLLKFIIPEAIFLFLFVTSYLMGTPFEPMPTLIIWGTLGMFLATVMISISDYQILFNLFQKLTPVLLLISLLAIPVTRISGGYLMHYSFLLVTPMSICFYSFFEDKRIIDIVYFLIFFVLVVLFGSRGAIGCILVFIALYILLKTKKMAVKSIVLIASTAIIVLYDNIIKTLDTIAGKFGFSSRTIALLLSDPFYDSGRKKLYSIAKELIEQRPLFGWGVAGERRYMNAYPHNIIYEFQIDYGKYIGIGLLILILVFFVISLIKVKGKRALFYIIFSALCVSLMWSGSYLSETSFWIMLYMSISIIKLKVFHNIKASRVLVNEKI